MSTIEEEWGHDYDPEEYFYYHASILEAVAAEIAPLLHQGKIRDLMWREERSSAEYVIRFKPTEKFDIHDLFNFHEHYPTEWYEKRRKWHRWR